MNPSVAIIGVGITGLTAARSLESRGVDVTLFEAADRVGGYMATASEDGWVYERGPNTLAADADTVALLKTLGVQSIVEAAEAAKKRFLVTDGKPVALPGSPPAMLKSSLFSWKAKVALAREPWARPADPDVEESVADFTRRRLGAEWLQKAIGPFVSGIYAGDPERLSLRAAFPRMYALERDHGGLIRGAMKSGKMGARKLYSGPAGLGSIATQLAAGLKDIRLNQPVTFIERTADGWSIRTPAGTSSFQKILVTANAPVLISLLQNVLPELVPELQKVHHAAITVVHHGYRRIDVGHQLDGFGMLIPRGQDLRSLGTLFPSSMFEGRTPPDHVLLTTFAGGMLDPELSALPLEEAQGIVVSEHARMLDIRSAPVWTKVFRVFDAIPQYHRGHLAVAAAVAQAEKQNRGLLLRGSYTGGVALSDRIHAGVDAALQMIEKQDPT